MGSVDDRWLKVGACCLGLWLMMMMVGRSFRRCRFGIELLCFFRVEQKKIKMNKTNKKMK